jgi:2-oxoglutarate ferredoxin oxidoreductase subunit beta
MTGGQMAPTTLLGKKTTTSPYGRKREIQGNPIRVCEMISTLDGTAYCERVAVDSVPHINAARKAIKKAFQNQVEGKGYSLIEVVSSCPTNWGMTPQDALNWIEEKMLPQYPLGVYRDKSKEE